ncbi:hypothetical protein BFL36_13360 [Clavibacter michiganensis]|uniref:Uncharacterized protein n=1 Tax=Clavibacter michiganensis TaxID=28447 RepID=A0A251Y424_9MICO|nr:hypothetical protein [Clavibacter michiganensis]OUE19026.1 hypothetical protein BFL36_13360 [Clavibacter michiganensis]
MEDPIAALDLITLSAFVGPALDGFFAPTVPGGPMAGLALGGLVSLLFPLAMVVLGVVIAVAVVRTRRATERIEARLEALERASGRASTTAGGTTGTRPADPAR